MYEGSTSLVSFYMVFEMGFGRDSELYDLYQLLRLRKSTVPFPREGVGILGETCNYS